MNKSRILDTNSNNYDLPLNAEQTASLGWITQTFATHPTRGLTPERLNRYLQAAEQGNLLDMAELGRDIQERDGQVAAELGKRIRAILTPEWQLIPPTNASAEEKKRTEQCQEWIADQEDIEDVFLDCLDGIGHGFACLEMSWANNQTWTLPSTITHRPQRWFQTPQHDGNELRLIDGSLNGASLWPYGWIVHKHRARSGLLNASGLFRTLAWPYLLKAYALGDWSEFLEVYGQPIRVGEYQSGATDKERGSLLQAVASMGHNAAGIISSDMKVTFHDAVAGQHEAFLAMIKYCDSLISKAILGGTLTSGADGKSSTNALGKVHEEVRQDLMQSDARQLAGTLTRDLVRPIYLLNFPGSDPARLPRFKFLTEQKENIETFAAALPKLVQVGYRIPLQWAHNKVGIPLAKEGEAVLEIQPEQTAALPLAKQRQQLALKARLCQQLTLPVVVGLQQNQAPGQTQLDAIVNHYTNGPADLTAALQDMLAPIIEAIARGFTPDDIAATLIEQYPAIKDEDITNVLTQAFFIADIIGRIHADTV